MFFTNINLKANTFKSLAIATSLLGVIFIILAGYIGNLTIRIAMVVAIVVFILNIKMTYHYSGKLKKFTDIICLIGAIVVFIFPQLVVFIIGIALMYFSGIALFQMVKSGDYDDKIKLIVSIIGVIFSTFCIFNASGTLELVIRLIGALLLAIGCICLFQYIAKSRQANDPQTQDHKFEDNEKIIEVQEIIDVKEEE